MGKLHQTLAVEKDIKNVMSKVLTEARKTFGDRSALFLETRKSYLPHNADDTDLPDEEFTPMVTTVKEKMDYIQESVIRLLDIELQKEKANQKAVGDLIVERNNGDKELIMAGLPVTLLVQYENILENLRDVYNTAPTLDPAKVWEKDKNRKDVYIADPVKRVRTKKLPEVIVKHEGNDKFPPQTELVTMDKVVGVWTHSFASGALSPKQKSNILRRIDQLIAGVKIARAKANETEVGSEEIGKKLFTFINEGLND